VNKGKELLQTSRSLATGEYKFEAKVMDQTYELTYLQRERTDNQETMKNMVDYLNQSVPGINALVEKGTSNNYSRIVIASDMSGRFGDKNFSFDDADLFRESIVDFFGLNRIEKPPTYAQFELNGVEKQTATNAFTLENTLRINLHSTGDQPINLRIVPDSEKILSAVDSVLTTYNHLINLAKDRTLDNQEHIRATKLISEMKSLETVYQEELEACGLVAFEDGILKMDDALAVQAAEDGGMESFFTRENGFIARLLDKAETIAINPMEYLDKTIVTYPNSEKIPFRNPYITSMYSGLFFSSYC
jgi:flagellar hook-associated protein 2